MAFPPSEPGSDRYCSRLGKEGLLFFIADLLFLQIIVVYKADTAEGFCQLLLLGCIRVDSVFVG